MSELLLVALAVLASFSLAALAVMAAYDIGYARGKRAGQRQERSRWVQGVLR
jgi:hypothetical protein